MPEKDWNNGLESEPVTTYVDEGTKDAWRRHAENLDVSLSRFVEMMVNAGRSVYSDTAPEGDDAVAAQREIEALEQRLETVENAPEPADALDVYARLDSERYTRVDDIAPRIGADESRVYESLQLLMDEDLVEYDAVKNGYRRA